jgi:chemotaxis signal transduction protein
MPLPGSPPFVLGLANHRGTILPILDLMAALGGAQPMAELPEWALMAGHDGRGLALAVDHAPSVLTLDREEILKISDDLSPIGGEFIQGKTHDGILLLNADRLVEDPRWVIRESAGLFQ